MLFTPLLRLRKDQHTNTKFRSFFSLWWLVPTITYFWLKTAVFCMVKRIKIEHWHYPQQRKSTAKFRSNARPGLSIKSLRGNQHTARQYSRGYTHEPCVSFVIAVVDSADGQTFLAQSPYVFYEGEKCKVVGTIHNSNDITIGLCVYPLEYLPLSIVIHTLRANTQGILSRGIHTQAVHSFSIRKLAQQG
jgi:hypothetical protein